MTPRSTRNRILLNFLLSGLLLGPALAATLLLVTFLLEQHAVRLTLQERLDEVLENPSEYPLKPRTDTAVPVSILGSVRAATLPAQMFTLPDGVHEFDGDGRTWHLAIATLTDGQRIAVVENTTALERREWLSVLTVGGGVVMAVSLSLLLGFRLSDRMLSPLEQLAYRVRDDDWGVEPLASEMAADEVGMLARALDASRARHQEVLQRERDFSADASHELRTPLTVIQNAAELLETEPQLSARGERARQRILQASDQMNATLSGLLWLVRLPDRDAPLTQVVVADVLVEVVDSLQMEPAARGRLRLQLQADPRIQAPPVAVAVVMANLLRNALQYSGSAPVEVTLEAHAMTIMDAGQGLSDADRERLQQRGVRGDQAAGEGAGLGLSLVDRLCRRFGWKLQFSPREPQGTCVTWYFDPPIV